jgi:hypothetical protein
MRPFQSHIKFTQLNPGCQLSKFSQAFAFEATTMRPAQSYIQLGIVEWRSQEPKVMLVGDDGIFVEPTFRSSSQPPSGNRSNPPAHLRGDKPHDDVPLTIGCPAPIRCSCACRRSLLRPSINRPIFQDPCHPCQQKRARAGRKLLLVGSRKRPRPGVGAAGRAPFHSIWM